MRNRYRVRSNSNRKENNKALRHVAELPMQPRTLTPDIQSIYCSVSASWARQSAQHPDDSGFTSAVRTQKTEDSAFANDHGNTVNGDGLAKAFSQSIQRNDRVNHGLEMIS